MLTVVRIFLRVLTHPMKYRFARTEHPDGSLFWGCITNAAWEELKASNPLVEANRAVNDLGQKIHDVRSEPRPGIWEVDK